MANNDSGNHRIKDLLTEVQRLQAENAALQAKLSEYRQGRGWTQFPGARSLTWLCILLTCAAAVFAPMAVWARRSFLDTDNFTEIVAPIAADETVARSISREVASRLFTHLELQKRIREALKEALPDKLDFMAGPVASSLQVLTQNITYDVVTNPQFQTAWEKILRLSHSAAVAIIRGDRTLAIGTNGELVLDAGELVRDVRTRLVGAGLGFLEKVPISPNVGQMVLFRSSQLGRLKAGVDVLDALSWLLPSVFLVFFAAAVLISADRRKTLMLLSGGLAVAMVLSLILVNLAERELLGEVRDPANIAAAKIVWDRLTAGLVRSNGAAFFIGLAGALVLGVAGPYAWARRTRQKLEQFLPPQFKSQPAQKSAAG